MLDLSLLPDGGASWLDASGEHADIVISTRIRLARNLEGYAFTPRARDGERLRILTQVREAFGSLQSIEDGVLLRVDELAPEDRLLLHERHLVSQELAGLNE
jgi:protein arginine kinase